VYVISLYTITTNLAGKKVKDWKRQDELCFLYSSTIPPSRSLVFGSIFQVENVEKIWEFEFVWLVNHHKERFSFSEVSLLCFLSLFMYFFSILLTNLIVMCPKYIGWRFWTVLHDTGEIYGAPTTDEHLRGPHNGGIRLCKAMNKK